MKVCRTCPPGSPPKPASDFSERSTKCRTCVNASRRERYKTDSSFREKTLSAKWYDANKKRARDNQIKRKYGITPEVYDAMLCGQLGACAICNGPSVGGPFHIDHDHKTNKIRGILCKHCNLMLGYAKDDERTLIAAASYLRKSREGQVARGR